MHNHKSSITPGTYRFVVSDELSGQRLDQYLSSASENFSRTIARRLIDLGGVHYSGRRTRRSSQVVVSGDQVEVFIDSQPLRPMALTEDHVIYRDRDLIVIDKPAGMPTQPTPSRYQGTLYAELQKMLKDSIRKDLHPSIGMVQRLDRDTSGVMVFSIHKRAHKGLTEQFRNHEIHKIYRALINGCPDDEEGVFKSQLAKRRSTNLMVSVKKGGKYAETRYRLLQTSPMGSLVEIRLLTGRSHQIRAHFSEAGLPLLGDVAYGGPETVYGVKIPRQMLHASTLSFVHPVSGQEMTFEASLPADFASTMNSVGAALNGLSG